MCDSLVEFIDFPILKLRSPIHITSKAVAWHRSMIHAITLWKFYSSVRVWRRFRFFYNLPSQPVFLVCLHRVDVVMAHFLCLGPICCNSTTGGLLWCSVGALPMYQGLWPISVAHLCIAHWEFITTVPVYFCPGMSHCIDIFFTSINIHTLKRHGLFSMLLEW